MTTDEEILEETEPVIEEPVVEETPEPEPEPEEKPVSKMLKDELKDALELLQARLNVTQRELEEEQVLTFELYEEKEHFMAEAEKWREESVNFADQCFDAKEDLEALQASDPVVDLAKAQALIVTMTQQLAAAKAAAATSFGTPIGSVAAPDGLLLIGDHFFFNQKWTAGQVLKGTIVVDYHGVHAEYLTNREGRESVTQLADGGYRVTTRSLQTARTLKERARQYIIEHPGETTAVIGALDAPATKCRDACRAGKGVGVANIEGMAALAAAKVSGNVPVSVTRGPDGTAQVLHLHLK